METLSHCTACTQHTGLRRASTLAIFRLWGGVAICIYPIKLKSFWTLKEHLGRMKEYSITEGNGR